MELCSFSHFRHVRDLLFKTAPTLDQLWHQKAISYAAEWKAEPQLLYPNCTLHKLRSAAPMRWEWRLAGFVCSLRRGYLSHTERRYAPLHSTYWSARGLRSTSSPRQLPEPYLPRSACTTLVSGNSEAERRISTNIKNYKLCLFIQCHSAPVPGWSAWCLRLVKIFPWMALLLKPDVSHSSSRKYRSVEGGFFSLPSSLYSSSGIGFLPSALKCCKRKKNCHGLEWANRLLETDVNESEIVSYCFG